MKRTTERNRSARRATVLLPAALGWLLFFYWWRRVAFESTASAATIAAVVLVVITVSIFYGTLLWIRHNLGLARRGKRGFSTRYLRPIFDRDWLDRPLVFAESAPVREGTWFVVHADAREKRYSHQRLVVPSRPQAELPPA